MVAVEASWRSYASGNNVELWKPKLRHHGISLDATIRLPLNMDTAIDTSELGRLLTLFDIPFAKPNEDTYAGCGNSYGNFTFTFNRSYWAWEEPSVRIDFKASKQNDKTLLHLVQVLDLYAANF